jgi:hypothetical protein
MRILGWSLQLGWMSSLRAMRRLRQECFQSGAFCYSGRFARLWRIVFSTVDSKARAETCRPPPLPSSDAGQIIPKPLIFVNTASPSAVVTLHFPSTSPRAARISTSFDGTCYTIEPASLSTMTRGTCLSTRPVNTCRATIVVEFTKLDPRFAANTRPKRVSSRMIGATTSISRHPSKLTNTPMLCTDPSSRHPTRRRANPFAADGRLVCQWFRSGQFPLISTADRFRNFQWR